MAGGRRRPSSHLGRPVGRAVARTRAYPERAELAAVRKAVDLRRRRLPKSKLRKPVPRQPTTVSRTLTATCSTSATMAVGAAHGTGLTVTCLTSPTLLTGAVHHIALTATCTTSPSMLTGKLKGAVLQVTVTTSPNMTANVFPFGAFDRPRDHWREEYSREGQNAYSAYSDVFRELEERATPNPDLTDDSWRTRLRDRDKRFF